jgi:hypothetical protein
MEYLLNQHKHGGSPKLRPHSIHTSLAFQVIKGGYRVLYWITEFSELDSLTDTITLTPERQ